MVTPTVQMVAICALLDLQVAALVKSTVPPDEVVPIAMNCAVCGGEAMICELGMIAILTTCVPVPVPVPDPPVTVMVALLVTVPANP